MTGNKGRLQPVVGPYFSDQMAEHSKRSEDSNRDAMAQVSPDYQVGRGVAIVAMFDGALAQNQRSSCLEIGDAMPQSCTQQEKEPRQTTL